ncbi:unnamed protein product [Polarella glacialis]|uniref:Histidine kinase/HSP90-like ATPase domain-containing protein n=1 Tax=Polarella glacialis TaxID=89957 RepID=A0A813F6S5_POLGL|nr:unnamed protein product [Polarella glacialis]
MARSQQSRQKRVLASASKLAGCCLGLALLLGLASPLPSFMQKGTPSPTSSTPGQESQGGTTPARTPRVRQRAVAARVLGKEDEKQVEDEKVATTADVDYVRTLELHVSSPAILLNHIADRYSSTSRILMEFVDNAFDSAESLFDHETNSYQRPIRIEVAVNSNRKTASLTVTDNCGGMSPETLGRVTTNVGESQKRGQNFLNGQFGFGMQAFRACCSTLSVRSRAELSKPLLEIVVDREQSMDITMQEASPEGYSAVPETGTQVTMRGFDEQWASKEALSPDFVAVEIEAHFERLLSRGNLMVTVRDETAPRDSSTHLCKTPDYAQHGAQIVVQEMLELGGGQRAEVLLAIAPQRGAEAFSPARFFAKGRRIGNIASITSFTKDSVHRWDVWSHPQLVGYVDILGSDTGALRPMITRDEFKHTRGRLASYKALADLCEEPLLAALEGVNEARSMKSLQQLEDVLTEELRRVDKQEKREQRKQDKMTQSFTEDEAEPEPEATAEPEASAEGDQSDLAQESPEAPSEKESPPGPEQPKDPEESKPNRWADFKVSLVDGLPGDEDGDEVQSKRSALVGNTIMVNVQHGDFKRRYRHTRSGAPKIDERLCSCSA